MEKLFQVEEKAPEIQEVNIKDINIPEYETPSYMTNSLEGFGNIDEVKLVRKGNRYDIIDGRRRLAGLKAAGTLVIKAKVFDKLRSYETAMLTLMSNYCRSHNVISELEALQVLEEKKISPETIQKYLNVTKNKIAMLKRLKDLPETLYKALAENKITETLAKAIAKLNKREQKKLAKIFDQTGTITGTDLKNVKNERKDKLSQSMDDSLFVVPSPIDNVISQIEGMSEQDQRKVIKRLNKLISNLN